MNLLFDEGGEREAITMFSDLGSWWTMEKIWV